ncbi:hypothetical protein WISP_83445 [Willisornis vidua]|uniref:Uncharacterized protein n=1 Tax=Willisornis vidua TaxID=1566151 RepID=A0ABQ9D8N1_9PASS|nr:hypothetical protein WISP_83445 [Willisornis vidua]
MCLLTELRPSLHLSPATTAHLVTVCDIQMNLESLLTPDFYKPLYVSTAVENLVLTDQSDSTYKSDAFYRHVDE